MLLFDFIDVDPLLMYVLYVVLFVSMFACRSILCFCPVVLSSHCLLFFAVPVFFCVLVMVFSSRTNFVILQSGPLNHNLVKPTFFSVILRAVSVLHFLSFFFGFLNSLLFPSFFIVLSSPSSMLHEALYSSTIDNCIGTCRKYDPHMFRHPSHTAGSTMYFRSRSLQFA